MRNSDSVCSESCNYLCARGNLFDVTIEARTVEVTITQNKNTVCAGQPIVDTAHAIYGVPPYSYQWYYGNDTSAIISADSTFTVNPEQALAVYCIAYDACGVQAVSNDLFDNIVAAPPANAGPDQKLCAGGTVTIGGNSGNPTTNSASTPTWQEALTINRLNLAGSSYRYESNRNGSARYR